MKTAHEKAVEVCKKLKLPESGVAYLAIKRAIQEQDRDTRHACAESVLMCPCNDDELISSTDAHSACMNAKAL